MTMSINTYFDTGVTSTYWAPLITYYYARVPRLNDPLTQGHVALPRNLHLFRAELHLEWRNRTTTNNSKYDI